MHLAVVESVVHHCAARIGFIEHARELQRMIERGVKSTALRFGPALYLDGPQISLPHLAGGFGRCIQIGLRQLSLETALRLLQTDQRRANPHRHRFAVRRVESGEGPRVIARASFRAVLLPLAIPRAERRKRTIEFGDEIQGKSWRGTLGGLRTGAGDPIRFRVNLHRTPAAARVEYHPGLVRFRKSKTKNAPVRTRRHRDSRLIIVQQDVVAVGARRLVGVAELRSARVGQHLQSPRSGHDRERAPIDGPG